MIWETPQLLANYSCNSILNSKRGYLIIKLIFNTNLIRTKLTHINNTLLKN